MYILGDFEIMSDVMFKVKNIMQADVISVKIDTSVYEAMGLLRENNITGVPVVDNKLHLVGIITEKDVVTLLYAVRNEKAKVKEFMTEEVVSFNLNSSMIEICDCFARNHFRRVPILDDDGKVVGIVSKKDIIAYILEMKKVGGLELALQKVSHPDKKD